MDFIFAHKHSESAASAYDILFLSSACLFLFIYFILFLNGAKIIIINHFHIIFQITSKQTWG